MNVLGVQFASIHLKLNSESEWERWNHFGGTWAAFKGSGSLGFDLFLN